MKYCKSEKLLGYMTMETSKKTMLEIEKNVDHSTLVPSPSRSAVDLSGKYWKVSYLFYHRNKPLHQDLSGKKTTVTLWYINIAIE